MTQPLGKNYGGIMQAFALQKVLKDEGHKVVTIDYTDKPANLLYDKARFFYRLSQKITGKRKAPINFEKHINLLTAGNRQFINKYIVTSENIDDTSKLKRHFKKNNYGAVVVGSDQTWRPKYSPNIYNYYLKFLRKNKTIKRIAYSSSFGVNNWEYSKDKTINCAKLVTLFDAISVREQSGIELCKEYLGVDSECTLDPTLLLEKEDYLDLIGSRYNSNKNEGVFTYFLDKNKDKIAAAQYIANELATHTYSCQARYSFNDLSSKKITDYKMPAVQDWLASFANSKFVLTDSFHGMVFSIIFDKPFLVIVNKERGATRFESLLEKISGLNHLVYNSLDINNGSKDINGLKPLDKTKLSDLKKSSLLFLKNNLIIN